MISYADIPTAQSYFDDRLDTAAWDTASPIDQLKALKTATRRIDRLRFRGYKTSSLQDNEFPRNGDTIVPNDIIYACCELAYQLLDGIDPNQEIEDLRVTSGDFTAKANYDTKFTLAHVRAGIPSSEAWSYLLPYLADPLSVRLKRGV